jgi:hypothetical protein
MNKFTRDMLMAKYDGSKTVSNARYSSNDSERYSSSDRLIRQPMTMPDDRFEHLERRRMEMENRNSDYNRDYRRDYDEQENYRRNDRNRSDYERGNDYGRDYNQGRDYRGNYDRYDRDYGETQYGKMSHKDIEKWKHSLENADGTRGEHFKKEHLEPIIRREGIDVERMGGMDVFGITVNMMYADYCKVAKKFGVNHPEFYVDMAKGFLEDKDFHGNPEEKLWLYYKCIAESEE